MTTLGWGGALQGSRRRGRAQTTTGSRMGTKRQYYDLERIVNLVDFVLLVRGHSSLVSSAFRVDLPPPRGIIVMQQTRLDIPAHFAQVVV
jgi:hypothetical protein